MRSVGFCLQQLNLLFLQANHLKDVKDISRPGKFHESYVVCTQDKKQIGQAGLV